MITSAQAVLIRAEITNDPAGVGYAALISASNFTAALAALSLHRVSVQIDQQLIPTASIFEAMVPAEWAALSAQEKQRIQIVLSLGAVDLRGPNVRGTFTTAFVAGTTTRTNLQTLLTRNGSRAEAVLGANSTLSYEDFVAAVRGQV